MNIVKSEMNFQISAVSSWHY